jgi:hypothetical protein
MTYPDRDGAWRPLPAQRRHDDPSAPEAPQADVAAHQGSAAVPPPLPPPPQTFLGRRAVEPAPTPVVARASVPMPVVAPEVAAPESQEVADPSARRLSAPAVTAAALAEPAATALAGTLTVERPEDDRPPVSGPTTVADEARTGPSGAMTRLHIGWHTVSRAALGEVVPAPSAGAGLVLGRDRQHQAVPLPLFAPEPLRLALIGGVWAAQLLIFRAFALGARVAVVTTEPRAWTGFGERATGQHNRLVVLDREHDQPLTGTAQSPALAVYDLGMTGPPTAPPLGPWRTQLTVLRQLDRPGIPALQDARYTLVQRLGSEEAALAASALRLRRHSGQFMQFMADDMIALIEEGTERYVFLAQTGLEQQHVGQPRR